MSFKTPVAILQEVLVKQYSGVPVYSIEGSGPANCPTFTCLVLANGQTAQGTGLTKKDAKHDAAKNMLSKLDINIESEQVSSIRVLPVKASSPASPFVNYVGTLNELGQSRLGVFPDYIEEPILDKGMFVIRCRLKGAETVGRGTNKKDAKQDSAKEMLARFQDLNLNSPVKSLTSTDLEFTPRHNYEEIITKYSNLLRGFKISDSLPTIAHLSNSNEKISSWEELIAFFDRKGWTYKLYTFQEDPLILCLNINESSLLACGTNYQLAKQALIKQASEMIENGMKFVRLEM